MMIDCRNKNRVVTKVLGNMNEFECDNDTVQRLLLWTVEEPIPNFITPIPSANSFKLLGVHQEGNVIFYHVGYNGYKLSVHPFETPEQAGKAFGKFINFIRTWKFLFLLTIGCILY